MIVNFSGRTRAIIGVVALALVFLALRLPGIHLPYHQDEAKNVAWAATVKGAGIYYAHPPFMQMILVADYKIFGPEGFRMLPFLFSLAAAAMMFAVVKRRAGAAAAWWSTILFTVCFYNVWGSLQADVEGSVLPFLFLLAVYAYDRFVAAPSDDKKKWLALTIIVCLVGLLTKLSFVLIVGVIIADYLLSNWRSSSVKDYGRIVLLGVGFGAIYVGLLYLIQVIYPAFSIATMLGHAHQFTGNGGRLWLQVAVQGIKAIEYLSPLLFAPLFFSSKETFQKSRPFWLYLALGFMFYFVLFDFSQGALDKYLVFAAAPLAVMAGIAIAEALKGAVWARLRWPAIVGVLASIGLVGLNFLPQAVVGLYPKTEWFSKVIHGHWNILTPFMGGSGPMGFYVSFMFIGVVFIFTAILVVVGLTKKNWKAATLVIIMFIGVSYNFVFAEELSFGKINGSGPEVLHAAVEFIKDDPNIHSVMTYNDIGNHDLTVIGKYERRIYATPDFESGYRIFFAKFTGQYLVVDVPHLYDASFYGKFFAKCDIMFETVSGRISGRVYDCTKARALINSI